jgi:hypothetical protein
MPVVQPPSVVVVWSGAPQVPMQTAGFVGFISTQADQQMHFWSVAHASTSEQQLCFAHAVHAESPAAGAQTPPLELDAVELVVVVVVVVGAHAAVQGPLPVVHVASVLVVMSGAPPHVPTHTAAFVGFCSTQPAQQMQLLSLAQAIQSVQHICLAQVRQAVSPGSTVQAPPLVLLELEAAVDEVVEVEVVDEEVALVEVVVLDVDPPAPTVSPLELLVTPVPEAVLVLLAPEPLDEKRAPSLPPQPTASATPSARDPEKIAKPNFSMHASRKPRCLLPRRRRPGPRGGVYRMLGRSSAT